MKKWSISVASPFAIFKASIKVSANCDFGLEEDLDVGDIELTDVTSSNAEGQLSVAIANAVTTALVQKIPQQEFALQARWRQSIEDLPVDDLPIDIDGLFP